MNRLRGKVKYWKMAIAGINGSAAGKRAVELFHEIDTKCHGLSKVTIYSKKELIDRCLGVMQSTTMNASESFDYVEKQVERGQK